MNYQNVDKIAIKQLKDLTFKVPSYQRGYRWNTIHVEQFIEDIYEDDNEYCIQPLIVKQADNYYYVIDGQQRLTTIMIMIGALKYLNGGRFQDDVSMSLQYETRAISKSFLDFLVMDESFHCNEAFANDPYEHIKASFELKKSNLDIDYMINTFIVAMTKFKELGTTKAYDELYDRLMNHCKVIWYPIDADESIDIEQDSISEADKHERNLDIEQFSKLNMGKIPLTNAELIKAEFMNPYYFEDQYKHNIQLIAEQWYHMEISLHNPDFWAFIPHEEQYGNDHHSLTRLDEIFEFLLIRKYKQLQDGKSYEEAYREEMLQRFYLYNQMNEWIKASGANRTGIFERWEEVREAFESIKELYEHDGRKQSYEPGQVKKNKIPIGLYNFVGYFLYISRYVLQHSKYAVWEELDDIMTQDRSNRLHVIKQKIWLKVKEMLSIQEIGKLKNKLEELKYEAGNETNNNKIRGVLLLYNIILMSNNSGIGNRYDFLRFNRWTLEHIHAQNEKALVYEEDAIDTINTKINEIEESYNKKLEQIKEQVARIRDLSKREEIIKNETERLERNKAEKKLLLRSLKYSFTA